MNKFTKLLSVFVIAGAIGTGIAGVAGCKTTPSNPNTGSHQHSYGNSGVDNEDGTHKLTCSTCDEGTDGHTKNEAHVDANGDDVCDVCAADMEAVDPDAITNIVITADKETVKAGGTITFTATCSPATAANKAVTWSITSGDSLATIDAETGVLTVKADATNGGEVTVKATSVATPTKSQTKTITLTKANEYDRISKLSTCTVNSANFEDKATLEQADSSKVGNGGYFAHGAGAVVSVSGGVATTNGAGFYVDFGTTKEIIEGALTVKVVKASGTGWGFTRLMKRSFVNTDDCTLSGRDNCQYRVNGSSANQGTATTSVAVGVDVEIYFKIDKVSGTGYLKHGDTLVYEGALNDTDVVGIGIFGKATSDANQLEIKDVAVCTYDMTNAEYAAAKKAHVAAIDTEAQELKGTAWTAANTETLLSTAKTEADSALGSDTIERAAADTAYASYKTAVLGALSAEYKARLAAAYPAADYEKDPTEYNEKIGAANTAFDGVTEVGGFTAVYNEHNTILDAILTDSEKNSAKVDITFKLNNDDGASVGTISEAISGTTISLEDLLKAITADTFLKKVTIYTDAAHSAAITESYTPTAAAGIDKDTATLYVVIEDKDNTGTYTFTTTANKDDAGKNDGTYTHVYNTTDTADIKAEEIIDLEKTIIAAADCDAFKLGTKGNQLVFNLDVKAGQTITLKITGYSGSSDATKHGGITYSATNATTTDTEGKFLFTAKVGDEEHSVKTITYTATGDGQVVITVARDSNTPKIDEVVITVADAVA